MPAEGYHRVRVTQDLEAQRKNKIEILDEDGNVVADISKSVSDVTWKMGVAGGIGIVSIEVACERTRIESLEVPGATVRSDQDAALAAN